MNIKDILENNRLTLINTKGNLFNEISGMFSCDLLSHVMANADEGNILITILNNINVLGVASLRDLSAVIFPHNVKVNQLIIDKADELQIPLLSTQLSTAKTVILLSKMGVI